MPKQQNTIVKLTDEEITHLIADLDLKLKKCDPLGYPSTNGSVLPLATATIWNSIYKKLTDEDHKTFLYFKDCLRQ